MRIPLSLVLAAAVLTIGVGTAAAGKDKDTAAILGTYDVRYEEVSSNCSTTSITMARGTLSIKKKKKSLIVDITRFPNMVGSPRGAKIRASSKMGGTSIDGVDGKFSVAGRVDEGLIQLVFVAEYYVNDRPFCSQTWNVTGKKQETARVDKPRSWKLATRGDQDDALAVVARRRRVIG